MSYKLKDFLNEKKKTSSLNYFNYCTNYITGKSSSHFPPLIFCKKCLKVFCFRCIYDHSNNIMEDEKHDLDCFISKERIDLNQIKILDEILELKKKIINLYQKKEKEIKREKILFLNIKEYINKELEALDISYHNLLEDIKIMELNDNNFIEKYIIDYIDFNQRNEKEYDFIKSMNYTHKLSGSKAKLIEKYENLTDNLFELKESIIKHKNDILDDILTKINDFKNNKFIQMEISQIISDDDDYENDYNNNNNNINDKNDNCFLNMKRRRNEAYLEKEEEMEDEIKIEISSKSCKDVINKISNNTKSNCENDGFEEVIEIDKDIFEENISKNK